MNEMKVSSADSKHKSLVRLIRRIAREEAYEVANEVMDEHLDDYEHKEKPAEDFEVELFKVKEVSK